MFNATCNSTYIDGFLREGMPLFYVVCCKLVSDEPFSCRSGDKTNLILNT